MQRLLPPSLAVLMVVLMLLLTVLMPAGTLPWLPVRLAGLLPAVVGISLSIFGSTLFERFGTNIKTFGDPDLLVTDGPFQWSRNPMYLGFVLLLAGVALLAGSVTAWIGPLIFFVAAHRWYIPFEEARMRATFGESYDRYCGEVPRWLRLTRVKGLVTS